MKKTNKSKKSEKYTANIVIEHKVAHLLHVLATMVEKRTIDKDEWWAFHNQIFMMLEKSF